MLWNLATLSSRAFPAMCWSVYEEPANHICSITSSNNYWLKATSGTRYSISILRMSALRTSILTTSTVCWNVIRRCMANVPCCFSMKFRILILGISLLVGWPTANIPSLSLAPMRRCFQVRSTPPLADAFL